MANPENDSPKLFLLDAYALIFRAYFALIKVPRLRRDGFNTSAIFGFVNTLEEVLRKENPTHIAVCFDPQGPTFRHQAAEAYKATRNPTPEDIKLSVPIIKDLIKAYNIPILEVEGFEADDVIGTMAKRAEAEGFTTYMMTPDKDFGQLVSPSILQYKPSYRGNDFEIRGVEEVCTRYGISTPLQVIDILALMGDAIDNIPGCPGIGKKTAPELIARFGSVEELLNHTDQIKGKMRGKIEENAEQIRFSKFLATIRTDVPIEQSPDMLLRKHADREKLFEIFDQLEFRSLADRVRRRLDQQESNHNGSNTKDSSQTSAPLQKSLFDDFDQTEPIPAESIPTHYNICSSPQQLSEATLPLSECGLFIVSSPEGDMDAQWLGAAIATAPGEALYIPAGDADSTAALLDLLTRPDILKITPQAKRDYVLAHKRRREASSNTDSDPLQNCWDTSVAHYLVNPDTRHSADAIAPQYLGFETLPEPDFKPKRGKLPPSAEQLMQYACQQADIALRLKPLLDAELRQNHLVELFDTLEMPMAGVLARMEIEGVRIDVKALNEAAAIMTERIAKLEQEIYTLTQTVFNIGSPAAVGDVLFGRLALTPAPKPSPTGHWSTAEDVLEKIASKHPAVPLIMLHRQLRKLLNTYLTALPAAINPQTGKIHTTYTQTVAATGRLSSTNPNLQNIPIRDDEGKDIRRAFIADPGCLFLSADYSQIELRLAADFSEDPIMIDAFTHGKDIHAITAAKIYHKDPADVTPDQRRHAKTANFGILYGISAFGLSNRLGIPRGEAKELIDNYFLTFPTIRKYMSDSVEYAREHGYVLTKDGRRRLLPDINSKSPVVRGYAERNAINAPLQGTAADIIKRAMIGIDREIRHRQLRSRMIMQVHDELNFNVLPDELPQMQEIVTQHMEGAYSGRVTLTAESGVGQNWLEAH